jgi:hypothetical protein
VAQGFPDLPISQIVNVQWGGGIFVATGNIAGNVWTSKKDKWEKTFSSSPSSNGFVVSDYPGSGVYGDVGTDDESNPMFVLGGESFTDGSAGPAMFLTSSNGKDWTTKNVAAQGEVYLVTWDESAKTFYAGMTDTSELLDPLSARRVFEVALRSTDGKVWSEIRRIELSDNPADAPVEPYCSDKIRDSNGRRVPTSVFGYNKGNDILIAPEPINMRFGRTYPENEINHGTSLKIKRGPENEKPGTSTIALPSGMQRVWAVAFAGGVWQAAGQSGSDLSPRGIVATSSNNGDTWEKTLTDDPISRLSTVAAKSGARSASAAA